MHGSGAQDRLVTVSSQQLLDVYQFATSDEFVWAGMNKIVGSVFMGGLSVKITHFEKEETIPEEHQDLVRQEWGNGTGKELLQHLLMFGFAVGRIAAHPHIPGEYIMQIVHPSFYELQFIESSQQPRRYFVQYTDATCYQNLPLSEFLGPISSVRIPQAKRARLVAGAAVNVGDSYVSQIQANENNMGYSTMDGGITNLIFIRTHPTINGRLNSPVAILQRIRTILNNAFQDLSYAIHWSAYPLHAFEKTKNFGGLGGGRGGGGATTGRETYGLGVFANADILDEHQKYRYERQKAEMIDLQLALRAAAEGRQLTRETREAAMREAFSATKANMVPQPGNPNSLLAPSDAHNILLPEDQSLKGGPETKPYQGFDKLHELVDNVSYAILGIVPQVMNSQQNSKNVGDPASTLREWDQTIQSIQSELCPMLVKGYSAAYNVRTKQFVREIYSDYREAESSGNIKGSNASERQRNEQILARNGQHDDVEAIRLSRKRTAKQYIRSNIRVTMSLNHTPKNLLQELQTLRAEYVIAEDTFVRMAGRMAGIAMEDILLDQKDRDKERERDVGRKASELDAELKLKSKYEPDKSVSGSGFGKGISKPK